MVTEARPLRGSLDEFNLAEILQMMGLGNMTGALHLHRPDGRTGIIYFYDGFLGSCTELNTEALTLGLVLQQLGMATAEQLDGAYDLQTQDPLGKRIGELLIDYEIITPEQLQDALKTQLLWTVREMAQWQEGAYEFLPGAHLPTEDMPLRIEVTRVVMEVLRYTQEWDELQHTLPDGMRTRLEMALKIPQGMLLSFDLNTWRAISHVNAYRTVRRIASAIHQPELEVARLLAPLVERSLLASVESNSRPGLPIPAQRLSMESFDLFSLLSKIEQEWLHRRQPVEQLVALANFINWTMSNLAETYEQNGISLSPDTLVSLLERDGLDRIPGYTLKIQDNQIDIDDFTHYCRGYLDRRNVDQTAGEFHDMASDALQRALRATFQAINGRIVSPLERMQNQEAWDALFLGFQGEPPPQ
ncbi:MAG TPA: DUF4388 domain-containing protein [Ktedonobacterales bacterium]|jgi:hypothetical protein